MGPSTAEDARELGGMAFSLTTRAGRGLRLVGTKLAEEALAAVEALCAGTPAADERFALTRSMLAIKVARLYRVSSYLDRKHKGNHLTTRGGLLLAAKQEMELWKAVEASIAALGLDPRSAAALGFDLSKSKTLLDRLKAKPRA